MSSLSLAKILDGETGKVLHIEAASVYDKATKQNVSEAIASFEALKTVVDAFLTGEADDNGTLDRLSELVAEIKGNKDSIAALTAGNLKVADIINDLTTGGEKKALSAEQGKVLKGLIDDMHVFENAAVLDKIGKNADGDLTFNGKTLNGETGIAFGASAQAATDFTGKIKIVLEEFDPDAEAEPEAENA